MCILDDSLYTTLIVHVEKFSYYITYSVTLYADKQNNINNLSCGKLHGCTMKMCQLPWITCTFLPISMDTVKKFYMAALHDMLQRYMGIRFTLSLTAEGNNGTEL